MAVSTTRPHQAVRLARGRRAPLRLELTPRRNRRAGRTQRRRQDHHAADAGRTHRSDAGPGQVAGTRRDTAAGRRGAASVGLLTEAPGLWDRLSVARNLVIYARLYGWRRAGRVDARSNGSGSATAPETPRLNCRRACVSESRWRGPSCTSHGSCCSTSRLRASIPRRARRARSSPASVGRARRCSVHAQSGGGGRARRPHRRAAHHARGGRHARRPAPAARRRGSRGHRRGRRGRRVGADRGAALCRRRRHGLNPADYVGAVGGRPRRSVAALVAAGARVSGVRPRRAPWRTPIWRW